MFRILGILSKKIITVSFFSLGELTKYCKINPAKICVIYEGKEHILSVESDRTILGKSGIGKRPYVLAVSSLSPNKNFASIIRAIEIIGNPDFDIVIAGGTNPRVFSKSAIELPDFVKYVGYVTDNELRALYDHAGCFIYPSFYEGFGLPPLEALACGCPIIISNAASLPEVFQDGAIYCDPHSPQDIAEKIELIMSDKILRDNLRQKGFRRSNNLSWEKCAKEIFAVIEEVIAR